MRHCKAKSVVQCVVSCVNISPVADTNQEESSQPRGSAVFLRWGAAALSLPSPISSPMRNQTHPIHCNVPDLEGGSSTSRCKNPVITDTLSYRDDLQPLLPGASSANVHLGLTEGSQPRDKAMDSVTRSLFGLVCHLNILRVVALGPQSQKFAVSRFFFLVFLLRALRLYLASSHCSSKY